MKNIDLIKSLIISFLMVTTMGACCKSTVQVKPVAGRSPAEEVTALLAALYGNYENSNGKGASWRELAPVYFDSDLMKLIDKDEELSKGELGAVDADPFCDCQDYQAFKTRIVVTAQSAAQAKVTVELKEMKKEIRFSLWKSPTTGWRIFDVGTPSAPSLRMKLLESINRQLASKN